MQEGEWAKYDMAEHTWRLLVKTKPMSNHHDNHVPQPLIRRLGFKKNTYNTQQSYMVVYLTLEIQSCHFALQLRSNHQM